MANPKKVPLTEDLKIQFNTRISFRMRSAMDTYMEYMRKPLKQRTPESEEWPDSIVDIMNDALTTFFAEHPTRVRKGPNPNKLKRKETKK